MKMYLCNLLRIHHAITPVDSFEASALCRDRFNWIILYLHRYYSLFIDLNLFNLRDDPWLSALRNSIYPLVDRLFSKFYAFYFVGIRDAYEYYAAFRIGKSYSRFDSPFIEFFFEFDGFRFAGFNVV